MQIINKDKETVIASEFKHCKNFFQHFRGLMFSGKKCLLFEFEKEKHISLHMFFVFFAIDVVYLDKNKKVVEIKKGLKPFWFYSPKKKAKFIIEAPEGIVDKTMTKEGDWVVVKY
ncbi:MAG: DUF192 domain-containing protein [Nanoarchaeota archaeon]